MTWLLFAVPWGVILTTLCLSIVSRLRYPRRRPREGGQEIPKREYRMTIEERPLICVYGHSGGQLVSRVIDAVRWN